MLDFYPLTSFVWLRHWSLLRHFQQYDYASVSLHHGEVTKPLKSSFEISDLINIDTKLNHILCKSILIITKGILLKFQNSG